MAMARAASLVTQYKLNPKFAGHTLERQRFNVSYAGGFKYFKYTSNPKRIDTAKAFAISVIH